MRGYHRKTHCEVESHAMQQVEYYFSSQNLPHDRYMWAQHGASAEHWVPIAIIASFPPMLQYEQHGLSWIADALRQSKQLEVDANGTHVRRIKEARWDDDKLDRSIYAKGFGVEVKGMLEELRAFFDAYGKVNQVRMRRRAGSFKGSVFVEFADIRSVEIFLNADPKPSWNGHELLIMTKEAYCNMKIVQLGIRDSTGTLLRPAYTNTSMMQCRNQNDVAAAVHARVSAETGGTLVDPTASATPEIHGGSDGKRKRAVDRRSDFDHDDSDEDGMQLHTTKKAKTTNSEKRKRASEPEDNLEDDKSDEAAMMSHSAKKARTT
ncbi:uncharacterized protein LAESUDRAFT_720395 [Laetiporus sulphureus 93-53]|uniref:HTH La-type RNA-binding domain-containing protein n=1 Tax=Laetiporus sulphureus 93-53 TaxID=1314785 RepID=A0A165H3M9_9APHY|nr:uncharacterized protein LAESUDRAFT_720395 [Laetiporus sulphureus 93-53]KZT11199.1 hypothetical protein LAESUDRAFT_720395 [Laetiporus sulphureus 93-53]